MKKMDNKGFTLIEAILAALMSAIVALGVLTIMGSASDSYEYSDRELTAQTEAQIINSQLEERLLSANNVYYDNTNQVLKIYHIKSITKDVSVIESEELIWLCKTASDAKYNNTMYLWKYELTESDDPATGTGVHATLETEIGNLKTAADTDDLEDAADDANDYMKSRESDIYSSFITPKTVTEDLYKSNLLGKDIQEFKCDATKNKGLENTSKFSYQIDIKRRSRFYSLSNTIKLRNKIVGCGTFN